MRHTSARISYHVRDPTYDLPELLPHCYGTVDGWVRHCLYKHDFVKCNSFETNDHIEMVIQNTLEK